MDRAANQRAIVARVLDLCGSLLCRRDAGATVQGTKLTKHFSSPFSLFSAVKELQYGARRSRVWFSSIECGSVALGARLGGIWIRQRPERTPPPKLQARNKGSRSEFRL